MKNEDKKKNGAKESDAVVVEKTSTALVVATGADEFTLTDGGEIPPGWGPQHNRKFSKLIDSEIALKVEASKIESKAVSVTGILGTSTAWQRSCYVLTGAKDEDGKTFPMLRFPESGPLYQALAHKRIGARIKVVYRGIVPVKVAAGETPRNAHRWDVYCSEPARDQLSAPRKDALKLLSEEQKKHEKIVKEISEEIALAQQTRQIQTLEARQRFLAEAPISNAEIGADDDAPESYKFGDPF